MTFDFAKKIQVDDKVTMLDTGIPAKVLSKAEGSIWKDNKIHKVYEFDVLYECLGETESVTNLDIEDFC